MLESIVKGIELIKNGEVIAFPTETVYGLGADVTNIEACNTIYRLKGRPAHNPLIVHCYSVEQAQEIALFNDVAYEIAKKFWPGPLSLVLPCINNKVANVVTAGLETICIRIPMNDIALSLIEGAKTPIAAPSANISNYISSTEYMHVKRQFPNIYVIDGGSCIFGLESTILDLTKGTPKILRHGFITANAIFDSIGIRSEESIGIEQILAPGMLAKHYSPTTKIRINANLSYINEVVLNYKDSGLQGAISFNLSRSGDLIEAASNLYKMLIALDEYALVNDLKTIAVAPIPNEGIGIAINDRLNKAAA